MAVDSPLRIGEPVLRWSSRAHSIAEVESELARIWAGRDLTTTIEGDARPAHRGPDQRDEPHRHRAPPRARRALRGDDAGADRPAPVAHGRHRVGRSRRAVLGGRPGRGALRPAAGRRARDVRRDDPPDRRRRGGPASRRDRDPAHRPRPAGLDLVAGRTAVPGDARPRPVRARGPAHRRRVDVEWRRPGAADARWPSCSRRPGWPSATSPCCGRLAGGRPSPRSSTIRTSRRTFVRCVGWR